jgi:predicted ArsR family transcriptional regulator
VELSKSQQQIMHHLKMRGPQTVKILAKRLDMTTMGVRQHLADLQMKAYVGQTQQEKRTRGRPVHLWKLSGKGHQQYPDAHSQMSLELIDVIRAKYGEESLSELITQRNARVQDHYQAELGSSGSKLEAKLARLCELRSEEGYMAEIRLIPNGWLLVENHCPIYAAAKSCQQFCRSELEMFQQLFAGMASIDRTDYLLAGARRCAYKITSAPAEVEEINRLE